MNELVFLQNEQALTTSLKIAEHFEKRHDHILRNIEAQYGDLPEFGEMFHKGTYLDSYGRQQIMYTMNRDGFFMLVTGFSGKKARAIKLAFIKAFNAMEQKIIELMAERKSEEWRAIRQAGKRGNKEMCAVIQQVLLPLAREQGYTKDDKLLYINYQRAVNRAAGINPKSRDEQPLGQLYEIEKMQSMVGVSIKGLAARGENFKQIYQDTKQTLENYSRLSFVAERFLPAGKEIAQ